MQHIQSEGFGLFHDGNIAQHSATKTWLCNILGSSATDILGCCKALSLLCIVYHWIMTNVGLLRLLLCKRCIMRKGLFFPFLHHKSLCPGMKSCLSSLSLLMRESSTTIRLRTSLIISEGSKASVIGYAHSAFTHCTHRDSRLYLAALASSVWPA